MFTFTKTRFHEIRIRLEEHVSTGRLNGFLWELFLFGFKQAWACLFGGILLSLLLLTKWFWPAHAWLARYDFLLLSALTVQIVFLILRMETLQEAKVISIFHIVGTLMELFKTSRGSWACPESNFFRVGYVPLFSGFMYASVGSYMARVTRIFDMRYTRYPHPTITFVLAGLIYANFYTHQFIPDVRLLLFVFVAAAFGPTWVLFPHLSKLSSHAFVGGVCPSSSLHLGRGKYWNIRGRMGVSPSEPWLASCSLRKVWLVVPADDH
jgi:uncharacterized membrane protein YoaT (DUF817 family)